MTGTVEHVWRGPPQTFGLEWERRRLAMTRYGERMLWTAAPVEERSDFDAAMQVDVNLDAAGYAVEMTMGLVSPMFWERVDHDHDAAAAACALAVSLVPAWRAREAGYDATQDERDAAEEAERARAAEEARTYIPRMVAAARESLDTLRWAWARQADVDDAEMLLARADRLQQYEAWGLEDLVKRATANANRAREAMRTPWDEELALARQPGVAAAAHEACRLLTERDRDWARQRNGRGWGKAATIRGHVLAYEEALDEATTSHALRLLRRHRRQLPADLDARVFGALAAAA